ncbi:MAG: hypothetical protein HC902_09635 [Calothrix sp. SM1_5_4]|nr:hypothetical protein [Calothrix sp. SM1_5_4]
MRQVRDPRNQISPPRDPDPRDLLLAKLRESDRGFSRSRRLPAFALDLPGPCASFLKRHKPRALWLARTDFWPEMLAQTRKRNVPISVFSYTQKEVCALKRLLVRWRLSFVDHILCASAEDAARVKELRPDADVHAAGDTRYDQVDFRLRNPKPIPRALKPDRPCLVAGSTWPEDEKVLLPALADLLREGRLKLILVPHEPTPGHLREITAELERLSLRHVLFSQEREWSGENVLLVDKVGVLAELYLWADFAFVGGSFRKSVHSVMEALGAGCITFVGPKHANNREALEFKELRIEGQPGLEVVTSPDELRVRMDSRLRDNGEREKFSLALKQEFGRRLGASRTLAEKFIAK